MDFFLKYGSEKVRNGQVSNMQHYFNVSQKFFIVLVITKSCNLFGSFSFCRATFVFINKQR